MVTIAIWIKIASKSFVRFERLDKYTIKDSRYTAPANTTTISKFGPSGSLKDKSSALENTSDSIPNISKEIFFDLEYIF